MDIFEIIHNVLSKNGLITSFVFVGCIVWFSYFLSDKLTEGKFHGSAIAILLDPAHTAPVHTPCVSPPH